MTEKHKHIYTLTHVSIKQASNQITHITVHTDSTDECRSSSSVSCNGKDVCMLFSVSCNAKRDIYKSRYDDVIEILQSIPIGGSTNAIAADCVVYCKMIRIKIWR